MPPVTEIKLFFATNIIAKFGLGGFHFGIFDLATDFDEGLNHHWAIICSFDIKKIIESIEKELYDYDEQDYIINRSTSFVLMAYITLLFEFILLQIELDRWHWVKGDQFERCIKTLLPNHKKNFSCMFFKDEIDNLNLNFELPEIFNQNLTYEQAVNYVQDNSGNPICIHEVYSCNEILQSLTLYFERFMLTDEKYIQYLASGRRTLSDIMIWTLSRNKNIFLLNEIAQDLYFNQHIVDSILLRRYISKYEYFFILNANLSDVYSFNEWKEDVVAYEREMLAFDQVQKLFLLNQVGYKDD